MSQKFLKLRRNTFDFIDFSRSDKFFKHKKHSLEISEPVTEDISSVFDDFPNELLLMIFSYLNYKTLQKCRLVSRHWLSVLNTSRKFNDDLLYLHDCRLDKVEEHPFSTLMKSSRPFYSLKIGRISISSNFCSDQLWEKLSTTVISLDLTELKFVSHEKCKNIDREKSFYVFEKFHKLKTLKISLNMDQKSWEEMILYLKQQKFATKSDEIQDFFITDLSGDALLFEKFLQVMPSIKNFHILSLSGFKDMPILLQMHGNAIKHVGPNVIVIYHGSGNRVAEEESLKELTDLQELQLLTLDCGWRVDDYNAASINNFLNRQKSLENVTLECYGDIPCDIWSNVTKLTVRFDDTITSLAKLAPLVNLKSLDFCISESYRDAEYREIHPCFFGHEIISNPKLTQLAIKTGPRKYIYMTRDKPGKSCAECWRTMLESFPNLEALKFCHNKYLKDVVPLILDLKNLKKLILINLRCFHCFLTEWKSMPVLTHLELWQATKISLEGITKLCEEAPNLRHLRLLGAHLGQPDNIFKAICQNLPELEILEVDFDSPGLTKQAFHKLHQLQSLKVLGLGNHEKAQLSIPRQIELFENLPKLRIIRDIGSDSHTVSRLEIKELSKENFRSEEKCKKKPSKLSKMMSFVAHTSR
ncbi:uncharacterized protein LOC134828964 [Culicoides brevitarsis]|uniref:uncharacterized protein LOC134828964 n=1 Tax=Culicoides brevitarsis TaxID=469753 RepID=UPI00307B373F